MKTCIFRARSFVLPLALVGAFPVLAQSPENPSLGPIVVTATRVAQPLSELLADVTPVDRSRIESMGATGLSDLLGRLPGIEFQRNGGPGTTTGVFLRGAESRFTAVYVDGVRIDSQSTGGAPWEAIPLSQIDHIEVLRGPAAAVYGSDALGGVIQIFTKRGANGFAPFVGIGVGTYGTRKLDAGFSGASGPFDFSLGLADEQSSGYNARPIPSQNPDLDGYRSQAANLKLGLQINKAHRLEATYLSNDLNAQYDNGLGKDDRSLENLKAQGVNWLAQWTDAWSTRLSFSKSRERYQTAPSPYLTVTDLSSFLLHNEFHQREHLFTADLEHKQDHLENAPIDQGRSQDGVALGYGFSDRQHTVQLNVRQDEDSEFGGHHTAGAAYGYAFNPNWRATASMATAFRAPTLYQRFSAYGVSTLDPESARNMEVGLRYEQGSYSAGIVIFDNKVSNLITFSAPGPCASAYGCYANTAHAQYEGITLTAAQHLGDLNLNASLDLQDPRNQDTRKQLARRAKRHGTLAAATKLGQWTLGVEAQFSDQRYDDAANTNVLPGYGLLGLNARIQLSKDWSLLARVDNLLDKQYELASTYATAGRSFYASVKWAPQ